MALIANTFKSSASGDGVVSDAINTTGATCLAVGMIFFGSTTPGLTDSKSNTWVLSAIKAYTGGALVGKTAIYVCFNPTVGTGHTFTLDGTGNFPTICVEAHNATDTTATNFDVQNGAFTDAATTLATGSVTPSSDNALVISFFGGLSTASNTIDSGFTKSDDVPYVVSNHFGAAMAFKKQTTASAVNPTWTGNATHNAANIVVIKGVAPPLLLAQTINQNSASPKTVTSSAINSLEATGLIAIISTLKASDTGSIFADSKGNTWEEIPQSDGISSTCRLRMFFCKNPTTDAAHTITYSNSNDIFPTVFFAAFDDTANLIHDQDNRSANASATSLATGAITPGLDGELIFCGICVGTSGQDATAVSAGFTLSHAAFVPGQSLGLGVGYKRQTTAATINPSFTLSGASDVSALIASLKPANAPVLRDYAMGFSSGAPAPYENNTISTGGSVEDLGPITITKDAIVSDVVDAVAKRVYKNDAGGIVATLSGPPNGYTNIRTAHLETSAQSIVFTVNSRPASRMFLNTPNNLQGRRFWFQYDGSGNLAITISNMGVVGTKGFVNELLQSDGTPPTKATTISIICAGDSITDGYPYNEDNFVRGLVTRLASTANYYRYDSYENFDSDHIIDVNNLGVSAQTISGVHNEYTAEIASRYNGALDENILVFAICSNDIAAGTPPSTVYSDLLVEIGRGQATGFTVVVCTPIPRVGLESQMTTMAGLIIAGAEANDYTVCDMHGIPEFTDDPDSVSFDGTHPNSVGYGLMADKFLETLVDNSFVPAPGIHITPTTINHGQINIVYNQSVAFSATGGTSPYTFELLSGTLPNGITFDPTSKKFIGTPTESGTFPNLVIQAVDSFSNSGSITITLVINPTPTISITPTTVDRGVINSEYDQSQAFVASGGASPYTYQLLSGALPDGMSFDATLRKFIGTPTESGTFPNLVIKATDSNSIVGSITVSLTINPLTGVLVQAEPIMNIQADTSGWTLKAYVPTNWHDAYGNAILANKPGDKEAFFVANFTTSSIPAIRLPSTTGSTDNPFVRYSILGIYDNKNKLKFTLLTNFFIRPDMGNPISLTDLINSQKTVPFYNKTGLDLFYADIYAYIDRKLNQ